ncbi:MAG: phosphomannomutase/phosphoglucomutase [Bryobacteraceae bacterium]|jgi:phosphomannomutase/phosphoglucomutase
MLTPSIFREYDIRGLADAELPDAGIELLGRGLGTFLRRHKGPRVNVGRDVRLSSPRLHDAIARGLRAAGCDVTSIGAAPTPLLYYSVHHLSADGGVMITGSHNPPEYNGFKTMLGAGTIHGAEIQEVARIIRENDYASGAGGYAEFDALTPYVAEIAAQFAYPRRVKAVFDTGNGVVGPALRKLLPLLNVEPVELFFEPDGRFPNHHPDPTIEPNLEPLKRAVAATGAELGLAFDGDGDRLGAVDEQGHVIWGDMLMLIFGREILTRKPGATFIGEVKCSQIMYDELRRLGANAVMYKTGHSLIKAKMKELHAELAGEMSGHMFFADRYYGYDDALYAACRLIEIVALSGRPLSAQTAMLPKLFVTPELRFDCPDEKKFAVVERVKAYFQARQEVIDVDGVRMLFPHGWGLVRASNTQPVLVLRFEATTPELRDAYRNEVEKVVAEAVAAA